MVNAASTHHGDALRLTTRDGYGQHCDTRHFDALTLFAMDEALRDSYSPLTAPQSEVTLKRPANVDSQPDRKSPVVLETSLTGRPENDEERRVVSCDNITI